MIPETPPKLKKENKKEKGKGENFENGSFSLDNIDIFGVKINKIGLVVGGVAFAGFILVDLFFGKSDAKKKIYFQQKNNKLQKKDSGESWIVKSIKSYMLAFLIGIAREKILEALSELNKEDAKADDAIDINADVALLAVADTIEENERIVKLLKQKN